MTSSLRTLGIAALLGIATALPAAAQTAEGGTATATIPQILTLDLQNNNAVISGIAKADVLAGYKDAPSAHVLAHSGNVAHALQLQVGSTNPTYMTGTNGGRADKPIADLRYKLSPFSTTGTTPDLGAGGFPATVTTIKTVAAGSYEDTAATQVAVRMLLSWVDPAGTYELPYTFTVIAQ